MSGTRRKPGRLGPYVEGYRLRLLQLGYSPLISSTPIRLMAFLAAHVKDRGQLPTAGVWPLLDYLRAEGVVAPQTTARRSALDRLIADYRACLVGERELTPATVRGYVQLAHRFLASRVAPDGKLDLRPARRDVPHRARVPGTDRRATAGPLGGPP